MSKPIIICVDDEATIRNSLKIKLKKTMGDKYIIETAEGGEDALDLFSELLEDSVDVAVVISDYIMPRMKGDELLSIIHELSPHTVNILLTGQADRQGIRNAVIEAQLYRYMNKPWKPEDLKLTIEQAIGRYLNSKYLAEIKLKRQQIMQNLQKLNEGKQKTILQQTTTVNVNQLTQLDSVTQIPDRTRFEEYLSQQWQKMAQKQQPLSLILCSVDYFREYNNEYGFTAGNALLKQLVDPISSCARDTNGLLTRYGLEKFALIFPLIEFDEAMRVAEKIQMNLGILNIPHGKSKASQYVTMSVGVNSTIPKQTSLPLCLVFTVQAAVFQAQNQGGDCICHPNSIELLQKL